jgi:mxaJ protein
MCSPFRNARAAAVAFAASISLVHAEDCCGDPVPAPPRLNINGKRVLRVAADPNNLPFSNQRLEGFENKLATVVAKELGADLEYLWRAQRRGFFREMIKDGRCDVVLGVPAGFEMGLTTKPYYRSSYVFVTRKDRELKLASLDDPTLTNLTIGVQLVGDDGANPPAAHALARRGLIGNMRGYSVLGNYAEENPPARIVDAVAGREVDTAIVWGPLAGYFAKQRGSELNLTPVTPEREAGGLRFAFSIAMATRKDDAALRDEINEVLARRKDDVDHILDEFGIPRIPIPDAPRKEQDGR